MSKPKKMLLEVEVVEREDGLFKISYDSELGDVQDSVRKDQLIEPDSVGVSASWKIQVKQIHAGLADLLGLSKTTHHGWEPMLITIKERLDLVEDLKMRLAAIFSDSHCVRDEWLNDQPEGINEIIHNIRGLSELPDPKPEPEHVAKPVERHAPSDAIYAEEMAKIEGVDDGTS